MNAHSTLQQYPPYLTEGEVPVAIAGENLVTYKTQNQNEKR